MISNGESNISLPNLLEALVLDQDSQDGRLIKQIWESVLQDYDSNHDNLLNFDEFKEAL